MALLRGKSGQWLENADQTHLVLASGKLVLQRECFVQQLQSKSETWPKFQSPDLFLGDRQHAVGDVGCHKPVDSRPELFYKELGVSASAAPELQNFESFEALEGLCEKLGCEHQLRKIPERF